MSQEDKDIVKHAQQLAADAGYTGVNALLKYAASWPQWQKMSKNSEFIAYKETLSEEQEHIVRALKQQGHVIQLIGGYYGKDFYTGTDLSHAIVASRKKEKINQDKQLKAKVYYFMHEKGYESPLDYAAAQIPWRKHSYRKGSYVAHYEGLSEFDREVLSVLRMEGHIQPEREAGYYGRDYVADGELQPLLQTMDHMLDEAKQIINKPSRGR